jgi:hypothetical protein
VHLQAKPMLKRRDQKDEQITKTKAGSPLLELDTKR